MASVSDRARQGRQLMLVSVSANAVLALIKMAGGLLGHSNALIADGIESSLDVLSSGMMWAAIKYAERPPDEEHPYGHGKMESLAAVAGALILIGAGGAVAFHSLGEIFFPAPSAHVIAPFTLAILVGTIVVKEVLFRWIHGRGKKVESLAVETDAWHHRSDALTSLAAAVGISIALFAGPSWARADAWAALFSCGIIVLNGCRMLRSSIGEVLDEQVAPAVMAQILEVVRAVPGVTSVEKCRVRKSGLIRLADLHVRVAGDQSVREGHDIAHMVKDRLLEAPFQLADVIVHIEPEKI